MEKKGWKTLAIVFIILFTIESVIFIYSVSEGQKMINKERECNINICDGYEFYSYDIYEEICYCYMGDEIHHTEFLGG